MLRRVTFKTSKTDWNAEIDISEQRYNHIKENIFDAYNLSAAKKEQFNPFIYGRNPQVMKMFRTSGNREGRVFYGIFSIQARGNRIDLVYGVYTGNYEFDHQPSTTSLSELIRTCLEKKAIEEMEGSIEEMF